MIASPPEPVFEEGLRRAAGQILRSSTVAGRALMRMLALADLRGLEPSRLLNPLAGEFSGTARRHLSQFAALVSAGDSAIEASQKYPYAIGPQATVALRLAAESGNLSRLYNELLEQPDPDRQAGIQTSATELVRLLVWFFVILMIITFLSVFIVPTYVKMFEEFSLALPAPTRLWIDLAGYLPALFSLAAIGLLIYGLWQSPRIVQSLQLRFNAQNSGRWVLDSQGELMSLLSIAAYCGLDSSTALQIIKDVHPNLRLHRRLQQALEKVGGGSDTWMALASARLIAVRDAALLSEASSDRTRAWLMQRLIGQRQWLNAHRGQLFVRLVRLLATMVLAAIVMLTCVAVFLPLVELITGLS